MAHGATGFQLRSAWLVAFTTLAALLVALACAAPALFGAPNLRADLPFISVALMLVLLASRLILRDRLGQVEASVARLEVLAGRVSSRCPGRAASLLLMALPERLRDAVRISSSGSEIDSRVFMRAMERDFRGFDARVESVQAVATLAPIIGLAGTAFGMLEAFNRIATSSPTAPNPIVWPLESALISTALGIAVGVSAQVLAFAMRLQTNQLRLSQCSNMKRIAYIYQELRASRSRTPPVRRPSPHRRLG